MTTITLRREVFSVAVRIDGALLFPGPSLKLRNHSPDGFEWGYGGSGPSQLALGILLHHTNDDEFAQRHYMQFKLDFVMMWERGADGSTQDIEIDLDAVCDRYRRQETEQ